MLDGVAHLTADALRADLTIWLGTRDRFEHFLSAHRDRAHKKLRSAGDDDSLLDVRAELLVASLLTADRRFALEFEAFGARGGPDLTVAFRQNQRFHLEVTRLRPPLDDAETRETRVRGALLAKLRQLPTAAPNVLALVSPAPLPPETLESAVRHLRRQADQKEEALFTRRGYESAGAFRATLTRLSAILAVPDPLVALDAATLWPNPEARHRLPRESATALLRCVPAASPQSAPDGYNPPPRP